MKCRVFKNRLTFPPEGFVAVDGNQPAMKGDAMFLQMGVEWYRYDTVNGLAGILVKEIGCRIARPIKK